MNDGTYVDICIHMIPKKLIVNFYMLSSVVGTCTYVFVKSTPEYCIHSVKSI